MTGTPVPGVDPHRLHLSHDLARSGTVWRLPVMRKDALALSVCLVVSWLALTPARAGAG